MNEGLEAIKELNEIIPPQFGQGTWWRCLKVIEKELKEKSRLEKKYDLLKQERDNLELRCHNLSNRWNKDVKKLKTLEIIKTEFFDRSDFKFRFEETNDAYLIIEEWILDNKVNEMKIPFDRNKIDLLKEVLL